MYDLLISVGKEAIWNKNSANYLCSFRSSVLYKHRQNLRAADFRKAKDSFTVPHYFNIVNGGGTEHYLRRGFPTYIVTCISQLRLNYSSIFNRGKWFDLGMFEDRPCKLCGERDSFSHIFDCDQLTESRSKILPPHLSTFDKIMGAVHRDIRQHDIKNIYIYISTVLRNR